MKSQGNRNETEPEDGRARRGENIQFKDSPRSSVFSPGMLDGPYLPKVHILPISGCYQ